MLKSFGKVFDVLFWVGLLFIAILANPATAVGVYLMFNGAIFIWKMFWMCCELLFNGKLS